jgi:hypothetical protein
VGVGVGATTAVAGGVGVVMEGGGAVVAGGGVTAVAVGVAAGGIVPVLPGDIAAGMPVGLVDAADATNVGSSGGRSPLCARSGSSVVCGADGAG